MSLNDIDLELEIKNFQSCWHQGQTGFQEGQKSARRIAELLKLRYGSSFSTKYISRKMISRLGYLNGMSYWKLKMYLDDLK
jgi:hypothetical protein